MGQPNKPIQIRVLPRANEKDSPPQQPKPAPGARPSKMDIAKQRWMRPKSPMLRTYLIVGGAVAVTFFILFSDPQPVEKTRASAAKTTVRLDDNSPEALVNRYLQDAEARREMAMKNRELENKITAQPLGNDAAVRPQNDDRQLGVSLDQENTAEKVYKDLYGQDGNHGPISPADRISQRLQQDQWLAQTQTQERKQYVQNFIKEAYDAGYAIDLDENLVVVRVKKVTSRPKESLDKVLENLARKGF